MFFIANQLIREQFGNDLFIAGLHLLLMHQPDCSNNHVSK